MSSVDKLSDHLLGSGFGPHQTLIFRLVDTVDRDRFIVSSTEKTSIQSAGGGKLKILFRCINVC